MYEYWISRAHNVPATEMSTHGLVSGELARFPCVYILHEYLRCSALSCLSMTVSQARDIVWWSIGHTSPISDIVLTLTLSVMHRA